MPEAYRKFWREWRETKPTAVHYLPKEEGKWTRDDLTGQVKPVQEILVPLRFPPESNQGIWGGEGVVQGFQKRTPYKRRVPHFWVPVLRRSVLRSEILDQHFSTVITDRTMALIHDSKGFDHYILKTPACDLQSALAVGFKRRMLLTLRDECPDLKHEQRESVLKEYTKYLTQYKPDEIEWYGLTWEQAIKQVQRQQLEAQEIVPHKVLFRQRLLEQLNEAKHRVNESSNETDMTESLPGGQAGAWLKKLNPFSKKTVD